ncbi:MAG: hypothetical protein C4576_11370 [Desulfobacteraceae bacterium]|nr:MAG: hypothetical protein C4576_11370 [Desulfobacteraceae bacterium]
MTRRYLGPFPNPGFAKQVNEVMETSLVGLISGEIGADYLGVPLGAAKGEGKVVDVWLSLGDSGRDDGDALSVELDVKINGTSCLTTKPEISGEAGAASTNKTTKEDDDTGVTQAVIDTSNNEYVAGDVFTYDLTLTRTATPTTEMANAVIVVELEPNN